jgi:hypothetical protein
MSLADLVVLIHLSFVVFVMAGGFLLPRWPVLVWAHAPAVVWGAYVEFSGAICPLTPLENRLRAEAGGETYAGGFVERYLLPVLYPEALTPSIQQALGVLVVLVNLIAYGLAWRAWRHRRNG